MFVTLSLCLLARDSLYTEFLVVLVFGTRHQCLGPEIVDSRFRTHPVKSWIVYTVYPCWGMVINSLKKGSLYHFIARIRISIFHDSMFTSMMIDPQF